MLKKINEMDLLVESIDTLYGKVSKAINESNEEESEDGIWWNGSSSGNIEIQLTKDQAASASVGGIDNESAIDDLLTNPEISSQFDDISDDALKSELEDYGAWDDEELSDREMNIKRVLWLAAGDISNGLVEGDMNESEEYEDLDESSGDIDEELTDREKIEFCKKVAEKFKFTFEEYKERDNTYYLFRRLIDERVVIGNLTLDESYQRSQAEDFSSVFVYKTRGLDESSKLNEATSKDWTGQDVIESRDIIERLDELESDEDSLDDNDKEELEVLREFKNAFGDHDDWKRGIAIINRSYFVEHVKELLADIGIPENLENFPSYIAIDWDATANNIERDYSSYDINGTEFLARD